MLPPFQRVEDQRFRLGYSKHSLRICFFNACEPVQPPLWVRWWISSIWTQSNLLRTDLMLVFPRTRSKYRNQEYTTPIRVRVHDLVSYMIDMHCSNISMLSMCVDIPTHLTHQRWPSTPMDDLESLRTHELKLSRRGRTGNRSAKEMQHLGGVILLIYPPYENCMNTSR